MTWKDLWEEHAHAERQEQDARPVSELIDDVRRGWFGRYYGIWYSIGERAALPEAGWTLFAVLESNVDYLYRYHCAAALLKLMGRADLQPVDLSADIPQQADHVAAVARELEARIGPRQS